MGEYLQRAKRLIREPRLILETLLCRLCGWWMPSRIYVPIVYFLRFGRKLNLNDPRSFNEKLNWEKVYDRQDLYTRMADKYEVKKIVSDLIGQDYVVENYGVWDKWEDIDFSRLPPNFVLKCTHDSGGVFICKDKDSFDLRIIEKRIKKSLKRSHYYSSHEWPYKNIHPRIIADKLLDDHTGKELRDYKFWCFNGKPLYMYCTIKAKNVYENFYDMSFHPITIDHGFPRHIPEFEKPSKFELMKDLAAKLSKGIPFVRVDFFQVEEKVYFGEFTFYDWGGMRPFPDYSTDKMLGDLIQLPNK